MMMVFTIIIVLLVLMGYLFVIVVRVGSDGDKSRGAFSIIVNVWLWFSHTEGQGGIGYLLGRRQICLEKCGV